MNKREIYLNEYNVLMENTTYLPLVSGLLRSYAETIPQVRDEYRFMPFLFKREHQDGILSRYQNPAVAAFSTSLWNMNLSLAVARRVKERFPRCTIVFGGPSVPFDAEQFFREHPFVDVTVRGEGEQTFVELLKCLAGPGDLASISGISYRDPATGSWIRNKQERPLPQELDIYPSPYLSGVFDELIQEHRDIMFQVIIETNRGCPYLCSYCSWGQGGLSKRFRFFSLDRIREIADWCGGRKIAYVFCADSNFGAFKRDHEIAQFFVNAKVAHNGYPEKFRVCYAKNAEEHVFAIGKLLHRYDMEKGITLSRQTNCAVAAANVGRKNIRMDVYEGLQRKYNQENIPVYTELILGLPGESYESFRDGIDEILQAGIKNQLFVYFCQVYPNTELADPAYQQKHGIETVKVPLNEIHAAVRPSTITTEYEEIIVSTTSMDRAAWARAAALSWVMQLLHGMKLGFYLLLYLADRCGMRPSTLFEGLLALRDENNRYPLLAAEMGIFLSLAGDVLDGKARGQVLPEFGGIYWDVEEGAYLRCTADKERFYRELAACLQDLLGRNAIPFDGNELMEVVDFQQSLIPDLRGGERRELLFSRNIPEYFDSFFNEDRPVLAFRPQRMIVENVGDFRGDGRIFAKRVVLFGRKSGKMLNRFSWDDQIP